MQAEAVADLIEAVTPLQARAAFDQLEGTLTGRIREIDGQLFDLTARLEASLDFPDEGYHFIEPEEAAAALDAIATLSRAAGDAQRGPSDSRGAARSRSPAGRTQASRACSTGSRARAGQSSPTYPGPRAICSPRPSTSTGIPMTIVDTAGVREVRRTPIEAEGDRARSPRVKSRR